MLQDTSLVVLDLESENFKVQNFIMKYVEFKLQEDIYTKIKYNRMLATFYCDNLTKIKKEVSDDLKDIDELYNINEKYEKNILHCLDYLISLMPQNPEINKKGTIISNELIN